MPFLSTVRTIRDIFHGYHYHVLALVVLGLLSAILEGIGINAIIPLFSFFGQGTGTPVDFISRAIESMFQFFSVPFTFRYLLVFILILFFIRAVAMVAFGYTRGWISADFLSNETRNVLRATMHASWPFLMTKKIGTLQNSLVRDIQCSENLLGVTGQAIQSFTGFFIYLFVAFNISPITTALTIGGGAILLIGVRPFLGHTRRTGEEMAITEKQFAQFLSEHIIGMKSIKTSGIVNRALEKSASLIAQLRAFSIRLTLLRSASGSMFQPFSLLFIVILFAISYRTPSFNIISFAAIIYLIQKIFTYLESGQAALHTISQLVPYAQNVSEFKKALAEHAEESATGEKNISVANAITFENVSFSYLSDTEVLTDVNLSIQKGETVGIIGPSGAGKTSMADLLLCLFRPTKGDIVIDGASLSSIPTESWRRQVGYVSQDVFLLHTSIEENIRFYRPHVDHETIVASAKQANIYDFIMKLPEGFKTVTGDRGVMLSGGQRQRIALARALAGNPPLLILDEATSALDHESESLIQESIRALHGKMTVLIIAHRPSTVAEADMIFVLTNGRVVEQGSPQDLLKNNDSYFYKMQQS